MINFSLSEILPKLSINMKKEHKILNESCHENILYFNFCLHPFFKFMNVGQNLKESFFLQLIMDAIWESATILYCVILLFF